MVGYNTANPSADIYLILPTLTPTFGTTTNYANDALGGQTLTVTSTEFTSGGITNDFISFSVPSNFVPAGTKDNAGNPINAIQFAIGNYLGGTNPLDLTTAITTFNATGTVTFNFNGTTTSVAAPLTSMLSNGNKAFSSFGVVTATAPTTDISANQVTAFSFNLSYAAVPEPSTYALFALGTAGLLLVVVRRRRTRA